MAKSKNPKQKAKAINKIAAAYLILNPNNLATNQIEQLLEQNKYFSFSPFEQETIDQPLFVYTATEDTNLQLSSFLSICATNSNKVHVSTAQKASGIVEKAKQQVASVFQAVDKDLQSASAYFIPTSTVQKLSADALSNNAQLGYELSKLDSTIQYTEAQHTANEIASLSGLSSMISYFIKTPLAAISNKQYDQSIYRLLFFVAALATLILYPILSLYQGISGDEYIHHLHGEYVLDYFKNGDKKALNQPGTLLHYYGQSFDLLCVWLIDLFGIERSYTFRHILNALIGAIGIIYAGLTARQLGGYKAGAIAIVLLGISPRFFGHAMSNPMDAPFAVGYIASIYYMIRIFNQYPKIYLKHALALAITIGFTISIRVGGILLIPIFALFCGLFVMNKIGWKNIFNFKKIASFQSIIFTAIAVVIGGYFIGILPWPFALQSPLKNPQEALEKLTNISVGLYQVFEGDKIKSQDLPWYYLLTYIKLTNPIVVLLGFVAFPIIAFTKKELLNYKVFFVAFTCLFPLCYVIYKGSNVYGGWRHLLFVYPSLVVLAALFWSTITSYFKKPIQYTTWGVLAVLIALPSFWMVKNHAHAYVYYNELIGGVKNAYGQYETDYYFRSIKQGAEWLIENENLEQLDKKVTVVTTHKPESVKYYFKGTDSVKVGYVRYYEKERRDWDYAILVNTYVDPTQQQKGIFPPYGTIHTIDVDGVPICAVVKRPSKEGVEGFNALNKRDVNTARTKFESLVAKAPNYEEALYGLSLTHLASGNAAKSLEIANKALEVSPNYASAIDTKAKALITLGKLDEAIQVLDTWTKKYDNFFQGYYWMGYAQFQQKKNKAAATNLTKAINTNPRFKDAYLLLAEIYKRSGNQQGAEQVMNTMRQYVK